MVSGESPAVARRRLRLALRKAREAKGLTQGQVAEALDWSLSKVQRIESGDVTISSSDLKASLALFEITDAKRVEQLVEVARASRRKGWWDEPRFRQHLSPATMQLLQFEGEATAIRVYTPSLLPGLIQTRAYAETVFSYWGDQELTQEDKAVRLEARLGRRTYVLDRPDPPHYYLILDESVLYREVGGVRVMLNQFRELLSLMQSRRLIARIVPFAKGAHMAMLNHFILMDIGDEENAILYREAQLADVIEQAPASTSLYRQRFESLWETALSEEATAHRIEARTAAMLADLDQEQPGG